MSVADLMQYREIEQLKYRYMRAVDTKDWDLLTSVLAPDVFAKFGTRLAFDNREDLVNELRRRMDHTKITVHQLHQPEIVLDGDFATGTWMLMDRVIRKSTWVMLEGAAMYHDEYRRIEGRWQITKTGYERLYEAELSLADLPSFELTADGSVKAASTT